MSADPRLEELLLRYPLDLDEDELAELRAAAERDPGLDARLDALHAVDAALGPPTPPPAPLRAEARARLDALLAAEGADPLPDEADPQAWAADPEVPLLDAARGPAGQVVDLASARRRLRPAEQALGALAALLVIGLTLLLGRGEPEFGVKGAALGGAPEGSLFVQGEAGSRVRDGARRSTSRAITFRAVVSRPGYAVLLETQGDRTFVLHPPPGEAWAVSAGSNLLSPPGGAAYRPARPGLATYRLVLALDPPPIPASRQPASAAALVASSPGAATRAVLRIDWSPPP